MYFEINGISTSCLPRSSNFLYSALKVESEGILSEHWPSDFLGFFSKLAVNTKNKTFSNLCLKNVTKLEMKEGAQGVMLVVQYNVEVGILF